jgi:hypothetical protein
LYYYYYYYYYYYLPTLASWYALARVPVTATHTTITTFTHFILSQRSNAAATHFT